MRNILTFLVLASALLAGAQTTVTATVVDSDGTAWANGTYSVTYLNAAAYPGRLNNALTGASINNPVTGSLDASGNLSVSLIPTKSVIGPNSSPSPGVSISVCPQMKAAAVNTACYATAPIVITGTSQSVSTQINAVIVAPRVAGLSPLAQAYNDTEVAATAGNQYTRLSDGSQRCYSGSIWAPCAGSSALPSGTQGEPLVNSNGASGYATSSVFLDASQFAGADPSVQINACTAALFAAGGGVCDLRAFTGTYTMSQPIYLGTPTSAHTSHFDMTYLAPTNGTWKWGLTGGSFTGSISGTTLTTSALTGTIRVGQVLSGSGITTNTNIIAGSGTSWTVNNSQTVSSEAMTTTHTDCGIYQYDGTSFIGSTPIGSGGNYFKLDSVAGADMDSIFCTDAAPAGGGVYSAASGFQLANSGAGTFANGLIDIRHIFDTTHYDDILANNPTGDAWHVWDVCCSSFSRDSGGSATTAQGGYGWVIGLSGFNTKSTVFKDIVANIPGIGKNDILVQGGGFTDGMQFINVYMESNGAVDSTTSMFKNSAKDTTIIGGLFNTEAGSNLTTKYAFENTDARFHILGAAVVQTTACVNDSALGITLPCNTAGGGNLFGISEYLGGTFDTAAYMNALKTTTQSPGDSSTLAATDAFVTNAIAANISGCPSSQIITAGPNLCYFDDFMTTAGKNSIAIGSPTAATCNNGTTFQDNTSPGNLIDISGTGTSGTGEVCDTFGNVTSVTNASICTTANGCSFKQETRVIVPVLPGTTSGSYQAGLVGTAIAPTWTTGIGWFLSNGNGVPNDWYCRFGSTQIDSGIAATTAWTRLSLYDDGANVHWYVNGVEASPCITAVGSMPTNALLLATTAAVGTSGTSVSMGVDYWSFQMNTVR